MNDTDTRVEEYLTQVSKSLKSFPEKDQILAELRAHIWDVAHDISATEQVSVTKAFEIALDRVEEPQILANRFLKEYEDFETRFSPETQIQERQFLLMGILGLTFVAVISFIFTLISQETLLFWIFTLVPGGILTVICIGYFYYRDRQDFKEQVEIFRTQIREQLFEGKKKELTPSSSWRALGEHISGLIGVFLTLAVILLVFWIDITAAAPLFNENWYISGAIACYIAWITSLIRYIAKVFLGQIRVSRLFNAANNLITSLALSTLVVAYPFTIGLAVTKAIGSGIVGSSTLGILGNADFYLHIIFAIAAVVSAISAVYNLFKFGVWQPEEKRSLL